MENLQYNAFLTVFLTVLVAELGDKTQMATVLFATDKDASKLSIFIGASLALILASAIGVIAGSVLSDYIAERHLRIIAGVGFIAIGLWSFVK